MAYAITRLQIVTRARRKTETENDPNIDDDALVDELNDLVSQAWKIVFTADPDRFTTAVALPVTNGTTEYALPADFMSLRRINDENGWPLEPAPLLELDMETDGGSSLPRYRLVGGGQTGSTERLRLFPSPPTTNYELWYVVAAPVLSTDGAQYDCRFDEHIYVIAGLAGFICERQDRDSTPHRAAQMQARRDLEAMARKRDAGRAPQITDVRSMQNDWRSRYSRP